MTDGEMENIFDANLYFDDEPYDGQKYMILSYWFRKENFFIKFWKG